MVHGVNKCQGQNAYELTEQLGQLGRGGAVAVPAFWGQVDLGGGSSRLAVGCECAGANEQAGVFGAVQLQFQVQLWGVLSLLADALKLQVQLLGGGGLGAIGCIKAQHVAQALQVLLALLQRDEQALLLWSGQRGHALGLRPGAALAVGG